MPTSYLLLREAKYSITTLLWYIFWDFYGLWYCALILYFMVTHTGLIQWYQDSIEACNITLP